MENSRLAESTQCRLPNQSRKQTKNMKHDKAKTPHTAPILPTARQPASLVNVMMSPIPTSAAPSPESSAEPYHVSAHGWQAVERRARIRTALSFVAHWFTPKANADA